MNYWSHLAFVIWKTRTLFQAEQTPGKDNLDTAHYLTELPADLEWYLNANLYIFIMKGKLTGLNSGRDSMELISALRLVFIMQTDICRRSNLTKLTLKAFPMQVC